MKSFYILPALALADGHLSSEINHKVNLMPEANGIIQASVVIDVSDAGYVSFGFGPESGQKMANSEIVLFQWTDAQDVQLKQYKGIAANGPPTLLDTPVWKIKSEELDSDGKVKLMVEKNTADACDSCFDVKSKASLIWAHGTISGSSPGYHNGNRGFVEGVTPNAGYEKTLHIPPSEHEDDHGDHSDPDHVHEDDHDNDTTDDGNDHQHDDGHDHGNGKDSATSFGAAGALLLTSILFSF